MKFLSKVYYIVIPLLIVGISQGYTSFPLTLIALLPLLFISNRHTVGFFFVMYGGPLGGCIRAMYPSIPIYGMVLQLIGFVLMWDLISDLIKHNLRAVWGMLLVLAFFGIFFFVGPRDSFAQEKYIKMCTNGLLMIIGYFALDRSTKMDAEALTRLLLVAALSMYAFVIAFYHMSPGALFDYDWFRNQEMDYYYAQDHEHTLVGYQHIGMLIAFAVAIMLSQTKLSKGSALFYTICASQMVLMSGCRQAILAVVVIIVLRYAVFRSSNIGKEFSMGRVLGSVVGIALAGIIVFFILSNVGSSVVSDTLLEGDNGRQMLYIQAINIFNNNPLMGSGIGGFHAITGDAWPHNFVLEMLCETGLLGTIGMLVVVIYVLSTKHIKLLYVTRSGMFFFLVLLTLFVRVMVSSDLPESIELFSAVFAVGASRKMTGAVQGERQRIIN